MSKNFTSGFCPISQLFEELRTQVDVWENAQEESFPLNKRVISAFESQAFSGSLERDKLEKLLNLCYCLIGNNSKGSKEILQKVNSFDLTRNDLVEALLKNRERFNGLEGLDLLS